MNAQTCAKVSSQLKSVGCNNSTQVSSCSVFVARVLCVCEREKGEKERNCPCHIVRPMFLMEIEKKSCCGEPIGRD